MMESKARSIKLMLKKTPDSIIQKPRLSYLRKSSQQQQSTAFKSTIEQSACVYGSQYSACLYSRLIEELDPDQSEYLNKFSAIDAQPAAEPPKVTKTLPMPTKTEQSKQLREMETSALQKLPKQNSQESHFLNQIESYLGALNEPVSNECLLEEITVLRREKEHFERKEKNMKHKMREMLEQMKSLSQALTAEKKQRKRLAKALEQFKLSGCNNFDSQFNSQLDELKSLDLNASVLNICRELKRTQHHRQSQQKRREHSRHKSNVRH